VSALPVTRRAVDVFDHPGLFMVPLARPRVMSAAAKTHEPPAMRPEVRELRRPIDTRVDFNAIARAARKRQSTWPGQPTNAGALLDPVAQHRTGDWHHDLPELWPVACC
jgi:hypothetical protein